MGRIVSITSLRTKNITDSIRVLVVVDPVNDIPTATDDEYVLEAGDSLVIDLDSLGLLANDIDIDGDTLSAALRDSVSHGTITVNMTVPLSMLQLNQILLVSICLLTLLMIQPHQIPPL